MKQKPALAGGEAAGGGLDGCFPGWKRKADVYHCIFPSSSKHNQDKISILMWILTILHLSINRKHAELRLDKGNVED